MLITKREFIQLTMGGLAADAIAARIDSSRGIAHIPSTATIPQVRKVAHPRTSWMPDFEHAEHLDMSAGVLYSRFSSDVVKDGGRTGAVLGAFDRCLSADCGMSETNLHAAGMLNPPETFVMFGVSIILDPATLAVHAATFAANTVFQFVMLGKKFVDVHASRITNLGEIGNLVARDSKTPTNVVPEFMFRCDPPEVIPPLTQFMALLFLGEPAMSIPTIRGHVMLDGYYARGVC